MKQGLLGETRETKIANNYMVFRQCCLSLAHMGEPDFMDLYEAEAKQAELTSARI